MATANTRLWDSILGQAQSLVNNATALSAYAGRTVLRYGDDGFGACLAELLARALCQGGSEFADLNSLFGETVAAHPWIADAAETDLACLAERNPACPNELAGLLSFRGYQSVQLYRIGHALWKAEQTVTAVVLQNWTAAPFGIDIHPAARLDAPIWIDHGTGVVIGETAVVEAEVSLWHGVTLGSKLTDPSDPGDRHPKIRKGARVSASAPPCSGISRWAAARWSPRTVWSPGTSRPGRWSPECRHGPFPTPPTVVAKEPKPEGTEMRDLDARPVGCGDLGIDHPLVTVRDHAATVAHYQRLGFRTSPCSYHPWGTVTSVVMFPRNFIELIGVADVSRFGTGSVDGFCFGEFLGGFLARREGVSLIALHSQNARADAADIEARGLPCRALVDFRRDMVLPDGTPGEAVVSLGLFVDEALPEASHFICHQHRPELIWVPEWQNHPNGALGIAEVTYVAGNAEPLRARLQAFYGAKRLDPCPSGFVVNTGRGRFRVTEELAARERFAGVPLPRFNTDRPHAVAIAVSVADLVGARALLARRGVKFAESSAGSLLVGPEMCGNVILEFVEA